jgi:hypothetical protein
VDREPATKGNIVNNAGIQSLCCALLAIVATLGLAGCAAESADVPSAELAGAVEPEGFTPNSLHANALTQNSLIANPDANGLMPNVALNNANYSDASPYGVLRNQLRYSPTREMMSYLVSCALAPGQSITYTDTATGTTYSPWEGQLGLCPAWNTGPASATCQELVSACLLARVNALGFKVELSMRGRGAVSLAAAASVPTVEYTKAGSVIASFVPCSVSGAARNCGYVANQVGTCNPGSTVNVGAGAPAPGSCVAGPVLGSSSGNTVLRVCDGIAGCDHGAPEVLGESGGSCGTIFPSVTFVCPMSGNFAVMSGPQMGSGPSVATPGAGTPTPGSMVYPASELSVFPWQEGAFFGNIWAPLSLNSDIHSGQNWVDANGKFHPASSIPLSSGAVFTQMFACSGVHWTSSVAYSEDRVCAGGGSTPNNCAATPMGACSTSMSAVPSCPITHVCSVLHAPGALGDYDDCAGTGAATWANPVTIYLNKAADVAPAGGVAGTSGTPAAPAPPACL